ncbi:MAG: NAD(P)-dependent oxidoreductase [bacterium]|nr:NAD(P)-dependent oxidoreductase [bacterium]
MNKAIVTGGTGFVGKWLTEELTKHGTEVIVLVRKLFTKEEKKNDIRVRYVLYDSEEYERLCADERGSIDVFYHLAWGGVSAEEKNDCELQMNNISFSMKMLEFAERLGVGKFIATGTVAEYSMCESIMDVNARQTPNDMYGAAKTAAHYMLETRARMLKIPFIWAVLPSTFGEGRRDSNIITYTIVSLLRAEKPRYGDLMQMWDFLYVAEVARALRYIGEKGLTEKNYAIGSGVFKPLKSYIVTIRDMIDPALPLGIGEIPSYSQKAFSSCVSIYDLTKDTGYVPEISFEEGIRRTIPYYRNREEKG